MITSATTAAANSNSRKMPGPQKTLRLPSPFSKKKVSKPSPLRMPVQSSDSEDESKSSPFLWRKKVRLICTDPDATDSSSDEEMEEQQRKRLPKRLVREIFIPAHCSAFFDNEEDELFSYHSQCLPSQSTPTASGQSPTLPTNRRPSNKVSLKDKSLSLKKSKRKNPHNLVGVRQRRRGKWAAEIRDSGRGIRLWLGTFDSPLAAANAYEMASRKLRGSMPLKREVVSSGQRSNSSGEVVSSGQRSNSLGSVNFDDKEDKDIADDGSVLSANSTASILNEDNEHVSGCSDLDCIMKSPSSVLEDPISSGSEGGFDSAGIPETGSVCVDDYCFVDVKSQEAFQSLAYQSNLVEDVYVDPSVLVPPFTEEDLSYGELELQRIFDIDALGGGNTDTELLDGFEDDLLVGDGSIDDISFDLDTDSLAWIDIPDASR